MVYQSSLLQHETDYRAKSKCRVYFRNIIYHILYTLLLLLLI